MSAPVEDWVSVQDGLPPTGQRVNVMHCLNRSYDCTGEITPEGSWSCSNAFILPNMMLAWAPTHWRALDTEKSA